MTTTAITKPEEVAGLRYALDFEPCEAVDWFVFACYAQYDKKDPVLARELRTFGEAICHQREMYLSEDIEAQLADLWK
jgi:hypothetical protein